MSLALQTTAFGCMLAWLPVKALLLGLRLLLEQFDKVHVLCLAPSSITKQIWMKRALKQGVACRSLGDAVKQWRSRLAVTGDSAMPQQDTQEPTEEVAAEAVEEAAADDSPAGQGEYEYMAEGEGRAEGEQQSLAPATEEQAKGSQALDPLGLPDQDADDITAAEPEADDAVEESSERLKAEQALRAEASGRQAPATSQQEASARRAQQQQDLNSTVADLPPDDDTAMAEAEEDRARLDDSYVSAQMQRASLSDGAADGLPDQDMVLAEGGLSQEAAQQLRQDVELRVKAASEGTLQLDTSQQSAAYGQEVRGSDLPRSAKLADYVQHPEVLTSAGAFVSAACSAQGKVTCQRLIDPQFYWHSTSEMLRSHACHVQANSCSRLLDLFKILLEFGASPLSVSLVLCQ